jgi:hypothetical protein
VNDKVQLQQVRTWFDPMDMFRQIAPNGVVKKEAVDKKLTPDNALDSDKAAEIEQKPTIKEDSDVIDIEKHLAEMGLSENDLIDGVGCPFAGTKSEEAKAAFEAGHV